MIDADRAGDPAEALQRHGKLFPLSRALLGLSSNPIPLKAATARLGRDTGEVRLPLVELDAALKPRGEQALGDYGLL